MPDFGEEVFGNCFSCYWLISAFVDIESGGPIVWPLFVLAPAMLYIVCKAWLL